MGRRRTPPPSPSVAGGSAFPAGMAGLTCRKCPAERKAPDLRRDGPATPSQSHGLGRMDRLLVGRSHCGSPHREGSPHRLTTHPEKPFRISGHDPRRETDHRGLGIRSGRPPCGREIPSPPRTRHDRAFLDEGWNEGGHKPGMGQESADLGIPFFRVARDFPEPHKAPLGTMISVFVLETMLQSDSKA